MKRVLLGTFALFAVVFLTLSVRAQSPPNEPTYGKESTTVRVGPGGAAGECVVTEAPSPIGTKWGSTVTVVVLGECGGPDKTMGQFKLLSPMSAATPTMPVMGTPTVRRLAPDVVVIEAQIIAAPSRTPARVTYSYDVLVGGRALQLREPTKGGDGAANPQRSPFLLSICPMWPCQ